MHNPMPSCSTYFRKQSINIHFIKFAAASKLASFLFIMVGVIFFSGCKIVKLEEKKENEGELKIYFDDGLFDASKVVDEIWQDKLVPYFSERGTELKTIIDEGMSEPDKTAEKYGYSETTLSTEINFPVKASGKVVNINTESRNGYLELDIEPCDGKADARIQIGPVIQKTSIRDATELLSYRDFRNQLEFADISKEINSRVLSEVLKDLDKDIIVGKNISLTGAFTLGKPYDYTKIVITPITFEVNQND